MKNCRIYFPVILFAFSSLIAHSQEFTLNFTDSKRSFTIQSGKILINSEWVSPSTQPAFSDGDWKHISSSTAQTKLSDLFGSATSDLFRNGDIELEREIWLSGDKTVIAIRQKLVNKGVYPIHLDTLVLLASLSENGIRLKENPMPDNWNILVQKRFKNDVPECIVPKGDVSVKVDPFLIIPVGSDKNGASLLIGYLNQTDHLAHLDLSFKNKSGKTVLKGLYGMAEFNGISVPPKGEKTSQWIYITVGQTFEKTINEYTDRVGKYHNVTPPLKNAPTIFCSWYYHAWSYNEELFKKDLQAFKNNRLPFDVFLIDESWDVNKWGDMMPNNQFPAGMKDAADKIKELGYIPGIWTCPYLVDTTSMLAETHPEWVLKTAKGTPYTFRMNRVDHWVLDLTYPGVLQYLEKVFRRIAGDWGYQYFKFDFMRAVLMDGDYKLFNPLINRLEAYRMGLEAIRRGVGKESYISVCGGHFGGSLGIANSQRSGSDVVSYWDQKEIPKYRQNILRTWMSRLWHVDPDAMMVRRSDKKIHPGMYEELTLGTFSDKEAHVNALNQYIGGGLVSFTEDFSIIDQDRRELYKHVLPSVNSSSFPLDWYNAVIPSYMVTRINPICKELGKWNTVSIVNWGEKKQSISFRLNEQVVKDLPGEQFLLFEFFSQQIKGVFKKQDLVELDELDPHAAALIKIIPWDGKAPVLAGTDLHFSMGGVEISEWQADTYSVKGTLKTDWLVPVKVTAVFPTRSYDRFETRTITLQPNQKKFWIDRN